MPRSALAYLALIASTSNSAGILLYRGSGAAVEVLLIHPGGPYWAKKDLGAWSIPKGEFDEREDAQLCALREFEEELGHPPSLDPAALVDLGSVRQKSGKVVHCWAAGGDFDPAAQSSNTFTMEWPPRSGIQREFPEADRAEWFGPDEARQKMNPAQADFVDRLLEHLGA